MANENLKRLAPLTGVLFLVLVVASFMIEGESPDLGAGGEEIVEFYDDNEGQTIAAAIVASLAAVALVFFAATVRRALRREEREIGVLSAAAFGGGIVAAAGIATDSAFRFALAESADEIDPTALEALHALWENFFLPMVVGVAVLVLATSLAALRARFMPVWMAWIGFVIVLALFTPIGFFAFLVAALWLAILSVLLWRQEPATPAAAGVT